MTYLTVILNFILQCNINESVVLETANLMKSYGLLVGICSPFVLHRKSDTVHQPQDSGYKYVNLDDCYSEKQRSTSGDIIASQLDFWSKRLQHFPDV
jgi:alpha-galactosidase